MPIADDEEPRASLIQQIDLGKKDDSRYPIKTIHLFHKIDLTTPY